MGGADSLCHDASVKAIYPTLIVGEDVLRVVRAILVQVGWQYFQDICKLMKNEDELLTFTPKAG
jgi:hypothetical protein